MKLYSINTVAQRANAPGRIMLDISNAIAIGGGESRIYTRQGLHTYIHGLCSRLGDAEGLYSKCATHHLINDILSFRPDIIHLHNIHGHYVNYEILFSFLKTVNIPIVWTLHDCWAWTGHCVHYTSVKCDRWRTGCYDCPSIRRYPSSWFYDNTRRNWERKSRAFIGIPNLTIVCVSEWQAAQAQKSFLKNYPIKVISNGIDTSIYKPHQTSPHKDFRIIAVASNWNLNKGKKYLDLLRPYLRSDETLKLINGITDQTELAKIYSEADLFLNPSEEETFGMTTIEAMACGTPAIVNNCTALPETIKSSSTGFIVNCSDIDCFLNAIRHVKSLGKTYFKETCRNHVVEKYSLQIMIDNYLDLFCRIGNCTNKRFVNY